MAYVIKGKLSRALIYVGNLLQMSAGAFFAKTVSNGLTASTTQTRAGALQLTSMVNVVSTAANSGDAVKLPAATVGIEVDVYNDGANPIKVFPQGASDTIDGGSAAASVTLTNALRCRFICTAANTWKSAKLGATST